MQAHSQALPEASEHPRSFVPRTPLEGTSTTALLFGAYESAAQAADAPPWAWDPVLYILGEFDGSKMAADGPRHRYALLATKEPSGKLKMRVSDQMLPGVLRCMQPLPVLR